MCSKPFRVRLPVDGISSFLATHLFKESGWIADQNTSGTLALGRANSTIAFAQATLRCEFH